jgi:hypothetical protein
MGTGSSKTWFVYGKGGDDCWKTNAIHTSLAKGIDTNTTQFRHEIVLMALQLSHVHLSKIYLYNGTRRRIKCERSENALAIVFSDKEVHDAWYRCTPPKLASVFDNTWKLDKTDTWSLTFSRR